MEAAVFRTGRRWSRRRHDLCRRQDAVHDRSNGLEGRTGAGGKYKLVLALRARACTATPAARLPASAASVWSRSPAADLGWPIPLNRSARCRTWSSRFSKSTSPPKAAQLGRSQAGKYRGENQRSPAALEVGDDAGNLRARRDVNPDLELGFLAPLVLPSLMPTKAADHVLRHEPALLRVSKIAPRSPMTRFIIAGDRFSARSLSMNARTIGTVSCASFTLPTKGMMCCSKCCR